MTEHLNTEGVTQVGEIETRAWREARVAEDYRNAGIAGATGAYVETARWVLARINAAGPYDDTRSLKELSVWLADKIRETQSPKGGPDATT